MPANHREKLAEIKTFESLLGYLRDELDWPIGRADFEDDDNLYFEFSAEELGIDAANAAKIQRIQRLRPLAVAQPWGIFFVEFEPKKLPVVALRRILSRVALKKRSSANSAERTAWAADDLLFVSNYGDGDERRISLAHFSQPDGKDDLPTLKVLGWDNLDTPLHLDDAADKLDRLAWPDNENDLGKWRSDWRSAFTLRHREVINTSRELSIRLAELARALRDRIRTALKIETEYGPLTKLMKAFQESLVHDLDADGFADMYAQTIAYGLLTARIANPKGVTADDLHEQMPVTNPFLKELMETFLHVGGRRGKKRGQDIDFDELGVSEVVELLDDANMEAVVRDFGDRNPQEDPVIHFYELFLKEYDAKKRMQRGVFYTPRPVVSYIVRSVDELLRTEFGLEDGLADTTTWGVMATRNKDLTIPAGVTADQVFVQILDPATGTGTFLVEVIDVIHKTLVTKWKAEGHNDERVDSLWNDYVPRYLLTRLHGYELLMAPYAIAHLKIGLKLFETGYRFGCVERVRVYLTNSLEPASDEQYVFDFMPALAHEAAAVNEIKRKQRFTVVIGNPPYSKMSGNLAPAAISLVEPFRFVDGMRIIEKGALALEMNLQDDYVKFWGLLCANIIESGAGIASYISNSRYLESPSLRGLRAHLCGHFSRGFFLDLGGQVSERKSVSMSDENVFDIEQGVGVGALVLHPASHRINSVFYYRVFGTRKDKYRILHESSILDLTSTISVAPPLYRFTRGLDNTDIEFAEWPGLDKIMPFNSGSIITSRDNLAIDFDRDVLLQKIVRFAFSNRGDKAIEKEIGYSVKSKWNVERCKEEIRLIKGRHKYIQSIVYRPFDHRFVFYLPTLLDTPSKPVCDEIINHENLVLFSPGVKTSNDFNHVMVGRIPSEKKACSHDRATQMFPLYSYGGNLLAHRLPNISHEMLAGMDEQDVFYYIYAILHSPQYRSRYGNAVRDTFPRIPPVSNIAHIELFKELAHLGSELVTLHLMESQKFDNFNTIFTGLKNPDVKQIGWSDETVWLDAGKTNAREGHRATTPGTIGFRGVPEAVWNFHIGGYQVCHKWLKDRKGRTLSDEDIAHYQKIVVALAETIRIMKEIDEVIEKHGGWPGAFQTADESATDSADAEATNTPFERVEPEADEKFKTCVPLVTLKAAAGGFSDSQEVEYEAWVKPNTTRTLGPGMFVAQVVGKSMEPIIPDGAYCLFRGPVTGTRQGKIVLAKHHTIEDSETGTRFTVKRYQSEKTADETTNWQHTAIRLEPINPDFEPIIINPDGDELQVVAELVEVLGDGT